MKKICWLLGLALVFPTVAAMAQQYTDPVDLLQRIGDDTIIAQKAIATEKIRPLLLPHAEAVFRILFLPVLIAEVVFTGVRIMMRQSIVEQGARLTLLTFITIIMALQWPMQIIEKGRDSLEAAGRNLGFTLLKETESSHGVPLNQDEAEPLVYWSKWVGRPLPAGQQPTPEQAQIGYKFSAEFIGARIFGALSATNSGSNGNVGNATMNLFGMFEAAVSGLMALKPIMLLVPILIVALLQVSTFLAIVMSQMGILIGSYYVFEVAYCLGFAVMPLIYFRSFEKTWAQYLVFLTALALVPFLYYIMAAIGFLFSASLFQNLFPSASSGVGYAIQQLFLASFDSAVNNSTGLTRALGGVYTTAIAALINSLKMVMLYQTGSGIIAVFVVMGNGIGALAVGMAFRWNQAFTNEEMLGRMTDFFSAIQTGIGSSMSQGFSQGMGMLGSAAGTVGGIAKGIRGR